MNRSLYIVMLFSMTVVLCLAFYYAEEGASGMVIWFCLVIFYSILLRAFLSPVTIAPGRPTFISTSLLFYMFYFLLFYMPYQLHVVGIAGVNESIFLNRTYFENTNLTIIAATVGVLAFEMGMVTGLGSRPMRISGLKTSYRSFAAFVVSIQIILILLYLGTGMRATAEGGYLNTVSGGVAADGIYLIILLFCMVTATSVILSLSQKKKITPTLLIGASVSLAWALRILLNGDRNSFFLFAIVGFGGLFTYVFRAKRAHLVIFFISGLVIYNTIEILRTTQTMSISSAFDLVVSGSLIPTTSASSFNISTIASRATFSIVPDKVDFGYGIYKAIGFAGVVPLIRGVVIGDSLPFVTTSQVLNSEVLSPTAKWGVGSNIVSDFYIDFGLPGVALGLFLCGLFAGKMQRTAQVHPNSIKVASIYLMTVALFSELPRYSADSPVRPIVWTFLLFLMFQAVTRSKFTIRNRQLRFDASQSGGSDGHSSPQKRID